MFTISPQPSSERLSRASLTGGNELLNATGLRKTYGPTVAVKDVSVGIRPGEVIGLVGANGAGKSTLVRILAGVTKPDAGTLVASGTPIDLNSYHPLVARRMGIRVVYQELSLCTNLTVYENFYIEHPQRFRSWRGWRAQARAAARDALNQVFPDNDIDVNARLDQLPLSQRQMVEIARAISDPELKLLILDEPTSSLAAEQTDQLMTFARAFAAKGASIVFISHRLGEVMRVADQVVVMQNGSVKWRGPIDQVSQPDLINLMAEGESTGDNPPAREAGQPTATPAGGTSSASVTVSGLSTDELHEIHFQAHGGEIVGLAGLEASGQRELLRALFHDAGTSRAVSRRGRMAYVSGDRRKEGVFPLWSIAGNMEITKLGTGGRLFTRIDSSSLNSEVRRWFDRLAIKGAGPEIPVTSLSGGNQQKVLIARALVADADIILLDDPTRGVDIGTKHQLYSIFHQAAAEGKLVLWHSTQDDELTQCSRVLVMRYGRIVRELQGDEMNRDQIVRASFAGEELERKSESAGRWDQAFRSGGILVPLIAMILVYLLSGLFSPGVFTRFGMDLLMAGAIPLVLAALSQMFVIGLSHVDLGVGAFMGMVNVVSATILRERPAVGALLLLLGLLLYGGMGALIYYLRIPAIIMTLGASFVWTGVAYTIQSMPGGAAPEWLSSLFMLQIPVIPLSVVLTVLFTLLAYAIHRSRSGTVLRGFGNNPVAMAQSGWSEPRAYVTSYLIAALFAAMGGLVITAVTTASDANAAASYTMLTVASVVMGGGQLLGGVVSSIGAAFGAITLSLVGSLLGFLNVSSNYVPAVQGAILLTVLAMRLLRKDKEE